MHGIARNNVKYQITKDENGNELDDLEDNNKTLNDYCKKHKLL